MDTKFILTLIYVVISFFASFFGFVFLSKRRLDANFEEVSPSWTFVPFYGLCLILFPLFYLLTPSVSDFVFEINFLSIFIPLLCAGLVFGISAAPKLKTHIPYALLLAVTISTFYLPQQFLLFDGTLPFWADRLTIIAIWFIFSNFYYILNGIDSIMPLQTLAITFGIFVLSWLEATPFLYGLLAASLFGITGAYSIFNWYPSRLRLDKGSCQTLGFILGWLLFTNSAEGSSASALILIMYYPIELISALVKKISLRDKYSDLISNTTYYQANISGLSPTNICVFLIKLQIVFIILSSFQIYAPNNFSLILLSFIIGVWFLSKLKNWQTPNKTIKELNRDFMEDIKNNIEDIKSNISKD